MSEGTDADRALALAYRFLSRRERTRAEVCRRLQDQGFDASLIELTVAALAEHGSLDDERFARLFVEDKRTLEGWGKDRIARALLERGIERDVVDRALSAADDDEHERAQALLRRRYPRLDDDPREHERALGYLLRKGYDSELALEALRTHRETVRRVAMR